MAGRGQGALFCPPPRFVSHPVLPGILRDEKGLGRLVGLGAMLSIRFEAHTKAVRLATVQPNRVT